jgi:HEPN domain-containing protein
MSCVGSLSGEVLRQKMNGAWAPWWSHMMQPVTARDFLKAARQRLDTAEGIFEKLRINLEAQYIAGYAVECALKALIMEKTAPPDRETMLYKLTHGAASHRKEVLLGALRDRGVVLPLEHSKRMRRFDWTTGLRYETGRLDTGETRAVLKTANLVYNWVEGQIT